LATIRHARPVPRPCYGLNLKTGASTVVSNLGIGGQTTEISPVSRSADYSTVGLVLGDDSGGAQLAMSPNGSILVAETVGGATIVEI
jgi:hypothetical protein